MKLRIQQSSVTLRLLAEEIASLAQTDSLKQVTSMPGGEVSVHVNADVVEDMEFSFSPCDFSFTIPKSEIESWATTNKMGFRHNYGDLLVVVEKELPRRKKQ